MPINKNALIRYQTLDRCFKDRFHNYTVDDLLMKCEDALFYQNGTGCISRRQIFSDIKFMESDLGWSIPLERIRDRRKVYYRYSDPEFTINEQPLTEREARELETAIVTLSRFRGMPCNEWVDEVISTLEWRFHLKRSEHNIIGFEQNEKLKGLSYLSPLIEATLNRQVLRLTYQSYKENAIERIVNVHPYYIKQYNNRWYLIGLDDETHHIMNLALDRIHLLEYSEGIEFLPNTAYDFDTRFNDVIGVTIPNDNMGKLKILLRFCPRQFLYVVAKPLHPSQQIVDKENCILSIEVIPNYELDYSILSLGPDVEVLSPEVYREHIKEKLEQTYNKYK